jgi:hypothetical protein
MISSLSGMMILLHIFFGLSAGYNVNFYYGAMMIMGFAQCSILAIWGLDDAGAAVGSNHWVRGALGFNRDAGTSTGQASR